MPIHWNLLDPNAPAKAAGSFEAGRQEVMQNAMARRQQKQQMQGQQQQQEMNALRLQQAQTTAQREPAEYAYQQKLRGQQQQVFGQEQAAGKREQAVERMKTLGPMATSILNSENPDAAYQAASQQVAQMFPEYAAQMPATLEEARAGLQQTADVWKQMNPVEAVSPPGKVAMDLSTGILTPEQAEAAANKSVATGTPYYTPVQTAQGVMAFNARTGQIEPISVAGETVIGAKVDPALQGELAEAKETGKDVATINTEHYKTATSAVGQIKKIDDLIDHINTSDAITGMGAEVFKKIERAKTLFGSSVAQGKVKDTELLDVMMGSEVFPMIKALGIGARGMDTPAEREFMRSVLTGEISLNKGTLLEMAKIRRNVSKRSIDRWNEKLEKGDLDRFFEATGKKKKPISISPHTGQTPPAASQPPPQPAGAAFGGINPETGLMEYFDNQGQRVQ